MDCCEGLLLRIIRHECPDPKCDCAILISQGKPTGALQDALEVALKATEDSPNKPPVGEVNVDLKDSEVGTQNVAKIMLVTNNYAKENKEDQEKLKSDLEIKFHEMENKFKEQEKRLNEYKSVVDLFKAVRGTTDELVADVRQLRQDAEERETERSKELKTELKKVFAEILLPVKETDPVVAKLIEDIENEGED